MGTQMRVRCESYPMNTNMTGFRCVFQDLCVDVLRRKEYLMRLCINQYMLKSSPLRAPSAAVILIKLTSVLNIYAWNICLEVIGFVLINITFTIFSKYTFVWSISSKSQTFLGATRVNQYYHSETKTALPLR